MSSKMKEKLILAFTPERITIMESGANSWGLPRPDKSGLAMTVRNKGKKENYAVYQC